MRNLVFIVVFFANYAVSQYTQIPDPVFEQNLINQQIDSNTTPDGQVLTSAIASLTTLSLSPTNSFNSIEILQGLEGFTALQELFIGGNEQLLFVNIANNLNLKKVNFYGNGTISIIISAPLLEIVNIESNSPTLQVLNVTNCPKLKTLVCGYNLLTNLDVSYNTDLEFLFVAFNQLTQLTIGNNPKLETIYCYKNQITSLNLQGCPQLKLLYTAFNNLNILDVSQNTNLQTLGCGFNNLSNLNLSSNTFLKSVGCPNNNITSIDLSQNTVLEELGCLNNNITVLNLQNNPILEYLDCSSNNLSTLNLKNGQNTLLNGTFSYGGSTVYPRFNSMGNPNLRCILVDDVANCQTNWLSKDATSTFVNSQTACDNLLDNNSFSTTNFAIYPNPTTNILNISNNSTAITSITIFNMQGIKLLFGQKNSTQIDVSSLSAGTYIISIIASDSITNKKFVKI